MHTVGYKAGFTRLLGCYVVATAAHSLMPEEISEDQYNEWEEMAAVLRTFHSIQCTYDALTPEQGFYYQLSPAPTSSVVREWKL